MSHSESPEVNAYFLDSEFSSHAVTHHSIGPTGAGCRGTWKTCDKFEGEKGSTSIVEVQYLVPEKASDQKPMKGVEQPLPPKILRAVKRLRTKESWPAELDHWPMIERGVLCLARANVSETLAVVRMLGWYQDLENHYTYIAMEYYQHGNLRDWLLRSPPQDESWARDVMKQILTVLAELAAVGIAHRNIKPSNILIASLLPIRIKVGDFHNAKWAYEENGLTTQLGALPYVAPEMRQRTSQDDTYTTKVDMWALGIILHEILTGKHPFHLPGRRRFSEQIYDRFLADGGARVVLAPTVASSHAVSFLQCLLAREPGLRPTPEEAVKAPWFTHPLVQV